ncbi:MAG: hypothetical protein ACO3FA_09660, partial [Vulcanococcus sp.]
MSKLLLQTLAAQKQPKESQRGNVLILALVTAIVLTIGLAALTSRTLNGLLGAVFQSRNREARDIAESVITRFVDTLNAPRNRYLLVAGNEIDWATANEDEQGDLVNPCTGYVAGTATAKSTESPDAALLYSKVSNVSRPGSGWRPVSGIATDLSEGEYLIEDVEYLDIYRVPYDKSTVDSAGKNIRESIVAGEARGLIR